MIDAARRNDETFRQEAAAIPDNVAGIRNGLVEFASRFDAAPVTLDSLKLAASEALTNIVRHAYVEFDQPGRMTAAAWVCDEALLVVVCDEGCGLRPRPDSPGIGLGLPLIAQLTDDFRVEERPGVQGTKLSLRLSLDGSGTELGRPAAFAA